MKCFLGVVLLILCLHQHVKGVQGRTHPVVTVSHIPSVYVTLLSTERPSTLVFPITNDELDAHDYRIPTNFYRGGTAIWGTTISMLGIDTINAGKLRYLSLDLKSKLLTNSPPINFFLPGITETVHTDGACGISIDKADGEVYQCIRFAYTEIVDKQPVEHLILALFKFKGEDLYSKKTTIIDATYIGTLFNEIASQESKWEFADNSYDDATNTFYLFRQQPGYITGKVEMEISIYNTKEARLEKAVNRTIPGASHLSSFEYNPATKNFYFFLNGDTRKGDKATVIYYQYNGDLNGEPVELQDYGTACETDGFTSYANSVFDFSDSTGTVFCMGKQLEIDLLSPETYGEMNSLYTYSDFFLVADSEDLRGLFDADMAQTVDFFGIQQSLFPSDARLTYVSNVFGQNQTTNEIFSLQRVTEKDLDQLTGTGAQCAANMTTGEMYLMTTISSVPPGEDPSQAITKLNIQRGETFGVTTKYRFEGDLYKDLNFKSFVIGKRSAELVIFATDDALERYVLLAFGIGGANGDILVGNPRVVMNVSQAEYSMCGDRVNLIYAEQDAGFTDDVVFAWSSELCGASQDIIRVVLKTGEAQRIHFKEADSDVIIGYMVEESGTPNLFGIGCEAALCMGPTPVASLYSLSVGSTSTGKATKLVDVPFFSGETNFFESKGKMYYENGGGQFLIGIGLKKPYGLTRLNTAAYDLTFSKRCTLPGNIPVEIGSNDSSGDSDNNAANVVLETFLGILFFCFLFIACFGLTYLFIAIRRSRQERERQSLMTPQNSANTMFADDNDRDGLLNL